MRPDHHDPSFAYAIKAPSGVIIASTVSQTKTQAWVQACEMLQALRKHLYRAGYRCVKAQVMERAK